MFDKNSEFENRKKDDKHKPESRKKYERNNPNWTVRMPLPWHKDYENYVKKFGLSRREFMGVSLEKIKVNYEQIRTQAINEGFAFGRRQGHQEGYSEGKTVGFNKGRESGLEEGKEIGRNIGVLDGFEQGRMCYMICVYCSICGRIECLSSNSESHEYLIEFLLYHGWRCPGCY